MSSVIIQHPGNQPGFARIGRRYPAIDRRGVSLGLQPPPQTVQGFDAFSNVAARLGFGTPNLTEGTQYNLVRFSYDYILLLTLYRNHWISRAIVDIPAQDMVRAWPRLTSDLEPDDLTRIDRALRKAQTKSKLLQTLKWARLFGGAGALMVIKGHENRLDEPLDIETVEPGAYKGLIPFDRWVGIFPDGNVGNDIDKPLEYNLPERYRVQPPGGGQSFHVHASRILRFIGPSVPTPEYEAQTWWGISSLEPAYEEIRKRDNMSWNILSLTFRASIIGMKFDDLAMALSGAGMNQKALQMFETRMSAINHLLSNQSMMVFPKDGGLEQTSYAFSGLSEVYQQFQLDISGASRIPVTRLFGRTLTGLGQSNDADERIYEETIALEQDDSLRPQLEKLYPVVCMSSLGEVPDDLDLIFPSVRVLDGKEKADLANSIGNNIVAMVNAGIFSKEIALKELKQSSDVTEFGTNITDADIEKAKKEADMAAQLGAMPGGAPGPGGGLPGAAAGGIPEGGGEEGEGEEEESPLASAEPPEDSELLAQLEKQFGEKAPARDADPGKPVLDTYEFAGIPVSIEYRKGTRRQIKNDEGVVVYDRMMKFPYGFVRGTTGRDSDELDVVIGENEGAPFVFLADMRDLGPDKDKREDESKLMLGFNSRHDAEQAFLSMYLPSFLRDIKVIPIETFKKLIQQRVVI